MVGCARREERIAELAGSLQGERGKVGQYLKLRELFSWISSHPELGKVDVCINNAGLSTSESLAEGSMKSWRQMVDVNVLGNS